VLFVFEGDGRFGRLLDALVDNEEVDVDAPEGSNSGADGRRGREEDEDNG